MHHHISPAKSRFAALVYPQPAATSSCKFMPSACYLAQQHALLQFPRPAVHPHALAALNTQSPGQAAPARCEATCAYGTVGIPDTHTGVVQEWDAPPRTCLQMQVNNAGRPSNAAGARAGSGRYTGVGVPRTQRWPASRIPLPACMHKHGKLAWVRLPRVPIGRVRIRDVFAKLSTVPCPLR